MLALLFFFAAIESVQISGTQRLPAEAVIEASGLFRPGQTGSKADLDAACNRLVITGFFSECRYTFAPTQTGVRVRLQVSELPATQQVRIDAADTPERLVWEWLAKNAPLAKRESPDNPQANDYYTQALQRYAREKYLKPETSINVDLSRKLTTIAVGKPLVLDAPPPRDSASRTRGDDAERFKFGALTIQGVPAFTQRRVRALWTLKEGDTFTDEDVNKFIEKVFASQILPVEIQNATPKLDRRSGTDLTDVTLVFKGSI